MLDGIFSMSACLRLGISLQCHNGFAIAFTIFLGVHMGQLFTAAMNLQ